MSAEVIIEEGIGLAADEADGAGEAAFRPDDGSGRAEEASRAAAEDEGREEGVAGWSAGIWSFHGVDDEAGFRRQLVAVGFPCIFRRMESGFPEELEGEFAEWWGEALEGPLSAAAGESQFFGSLREPAADEGSRDDAGSWASGIGRMEGGFGGRVRLKAVGGVASGEGHARQAWIEPAGDALREESELVMNEGNHGWAERRLLRTVVMALSRVASSEAGSGISIPETMQW
jgi:hypothetical protein